MRVIDWTAAAALVLLGAGMAQAVTPADKCESDKNKQAGKYAYCRQKAEASFASTGDGAARTAGLQKCLDKYALKWPAIESKAGGTCPSVSDQATIQGAIDTHTTSVATALAGGTLPDCDGDLLTCQGDLSTCTSDLGTCAGDLTTCQNDLGTAQIDLATCQGDLATCQTAPQGQRLKTGQTTCFFGAPTYAVIPCAGTGQDGELQKGLARAYVDNGDGTITDTKTGLMWEKLSDDGSIHDKDNIYTWANAFAVKIAGLNAGGGFAGHTDWRLPNRAELESLLDLGEVNRAVSPAFNTGCVASCTVTSCSCTQSNGLWSSTTYQNSPGSAWFVSFYDGYVYYAGKTLSGDVRAVRGGS
jgi:hypothetical protein